MVTPHDQIASAVFSSIQKVPEAVFALDSNGRFVFANEYTSQYLGYSHEELHQKHIWEIDPSCSFEQYASEWARKNQSTTFSKTTHLSKQGDEQLVSIAKTYEQHVDFEVCIVHVRDISKREEHRNLLLEVINELPNPFALKNYEGKFILVNKALSVLYGEENPQNMVGKDDGDYIPDPEQAEFFRRNVREIMDAGETQTVYENSYDAKTGDRRYYMSIKKPFLNQRKEKHIIVIAIDITDIRRAEETLLQYEKIMSVSYDFLSFQNKSGVYKAVNEAYLKAFKLKREDIIGKSNRELLGDEHYEKNIRPKFEKALLGETSYYQTWMDFPGLGYRYVRVNYYPYRSEDQGEVEGVVVKVNDLTDHKKLEEKLKKIEKMEAIGAVAGGVAHDLNNILAGLVSYPELLLINMNESNPLYKPLKTIQHTGEKAAAIVEDLLTLSRRVISTRDVCHLDNLVENYLGSPEGKNILESSQYIAIEKTFSDNALPVKGAPVQITKVIMNLIHNAVDAMLEGGKLSISLESRYIDQESSDYEYCSEGEYTLLTVTDNGIGMTEEEQNRIFEPFYTKKGMGRSGSGLGMAIAWGVVRDHGGEIKVTSELGKGSVFTLLFPATRELAPEQKAESDPMQYKGNGEVVLIVDDVEEQRLISTAMLEQLGYKTTTSCSGEKAIDWLKSNVPDIVLLDMIMDPGINGLVTYIEIKKILPDQKVIIASGYSNTDNLDEAVKLGVNAIIKKPYSLSLLGRTIHNVILGTD